MMRVSSRAFRFKIDEYEFTGLVPFADMLNHDLPKQTKWYYDKEKSKFIVEALKDISGGSEVCTSYGLQPNWQYFLNYGFINQAKERIGVDDVPLKVSLKPIGAEGGAPAGPAAEKLNL